MVNNKKDSKKNIKKVKGYTALDSKLVKIIQTYFKSGELPLYYPPVVLCEEYSSDPRDYINIEYTIPGTEVQITDHLFLLNNIKKDLTVRKLQDFEKMAEINNWTDEQMAEIFSESIKDKKYSLDLTSYLAMKSQLLIIINSKVK